MSSRVALLVAVLVAGCATAGAGVESLPGVAQQTITIELAGNATTADVYRRDAMRPGAVVLLAHGFSRDRTTLVALSIELAREGFAVVVPDLPHFADHAANARFLQALADVIAKREKPELDFGAQRIIFAGFSAGGGASLVAAAASSHTLGWIGLDPVDRDNVAAAAASNMSEPAFAIRATPSGCNAASNFTPALARLPMLVSDRIEPGASHCDFEAPTDVVCTLVCGAASANRQRAIRAAVVDASKAIAAQ